ncbi:cobalamin biosynthesis protein [Streptomyces bingchenggensis BCW-1]|uniref:Cobalamin biosynthesis protein CobD n=1 Tax=Streptomyces bingchenggensis (strain BCW-1) TaxID=749414 RepID=D7CI85_STRBB|nr:MULTISPECIES: cobalamin biosynthesis protein [Streptomyces]ADI11263.1 cobalamin biosynthesis protein [Streptomyces bingchenggensis BCW-1]
MRADHASYACGAALGFLGDLAMGDPRRGHPVAAFGRAALAVERLLWRDHRGSGALYTALCAGGAAAGAVLSMRAVRALGRPASGGSALGSPVAKPSGRPVLGRPASETSALGRPSPVAQTMLTAAATWAVLGGTTLGREARAIGGALAAGDLDTARRRLPHLCGRDPQALDESQIARAVVESVAENTSDAVVGALVWGAVGGVPGLVGFRAVNTLDAMVGHKSPRYRRFGWASARLDDLAGWPGARLTAALAALAGPDPRGAWRAWRHDGHRHPSPNAGPVEAAFAGALGVRLGGTLAYGGRVEHRPVLNPDGQPVEAADIERAVRLSRRVGALALGVSVAARLTVGARLAAGTRLTARAARQSARTAARPAAAPVPAARAHEAPGTGRSGGPATVRPTAAGRDEG